MPCPKEIREWKPSMAHGVGRMCEAFQSQRGITSLGHQQPPRAARIMLEIQPTADACSGVERIAPSRVESAATASRYEPSSRARPPGDEPQEIWKRKRPTRSRTTAWALPR